MRPLQVHVVYNVSILWPLQVHVVYMLSAFVGAENSLQIHVAMAPIFVVL